MTREQALASSFINLVIRIDRSRAWSPLSGTRYNPDVARAAWDRLISQEGGND